MPLTDIRFAVAFLQKRVCFDMAWICPKAHRSAFIDFIALVRHKVYHFVLTLFVKFSRIGIRKSQNISCKFNHRNLHAEAYPEIRNVMHSRVAGRLHHAIYPAVSKSTRHNNPVDTFKDARRAFRSDIFRFHPTDIHIRAVFKSAVLECFFY